MKSTIKLKRVYDIPAKEDGFRILVDRLWPRGLKKEDANIDLWLKEIAPSSELRKWFNHESDKWKEFCHRYSEELDKNTEELRVLQKLSECCKTTFVYSAHSRKFNNAVALKKFLESI